MTITVKEMKALFKCWKEIMAENRDFLIETDSIVGDGDLGLTMSDGFAAAYNAAATFEEADIGKLRNYEMSQLVDQHENADRDKKV